MGRIERLDAVVRTAFVGDKMRLLRSAELVLSEQPGCAEADLVRSTVLRAWRRSIWEGTNGH